MKQVKSLTQLYTTEDVANALNLTVEQVTMHTKSKALRCHRFGHRTIRFTQNQFEDFLQRTLV